MIKNIFDDGIKSKSTLKKNLLKIKDFVKDGHHKITIYVIEINILRHKYLFKR